jgi:hypothetical protein
MGLFDPPGQYDENDWWANILRDPQQHALDQAIKANRRLQGIQTQLAAQPATSSFAGEAKVVELERKLLTLALYTRTILQLLVDKGLVGQEEFAERMRQLDLLDGAEDGR